MEAVTKQTNQPNIGNLIIFIFPLGFHKAKVLDLNKKRVLVLINSKDFRFKFSFPLAFYSKPHILKMLPVFPVPIFGHSPNRYTWKRKAFAEK